MTHPQARRAASDSLLPSGLLALGVLLAPTFLVGEEHSDTVWLLPTCVEHLNLILYTLPTPPCSAKPHAVGTEAYLFRLQDDQEWVSMGPAGMGWKFRVLVNPASVETIQQHRVRMGLTIETQHLL